MQCFFSENVLTEHRANCLVINGKQNVKLRKGSISFKNYSKQVPSLFKIYADFECIVLPTLLKRVKSNDKNGSYTEKYQDPILAVLLTKLFVSIINLVKMLFSTKKKMLLTNLLKQFLKSMIIVRG